MFRSDVFDDPHSVWWAVSKEQRSPKPQHEFKDVGSGTDSCLLHVLEDGSSARPKGRPRLRETLCTTGKRGHP